jgi:hypothetical protein
MFSDLDERIMKQQQEEEERKRQRKEKKKEKKVSAARQPDACMQIGMLLISAFFLKWKLQLGCEKDSS